MKLRRKLLSAGFAIGATALTLTTSTFAWYTENTKVTVGQVSGRTSAEADSSSVYIAAAQTYNYDSTGTKAITPATWGIYSNEVAPVYTAGSMDSSVSTILLKPVSYVDNATGTAVYLPLTGAATTTSNTTQKVAPVYGEYSDTNVVEFVLRFRTANAGEATKLYWSKFNFANTASATTDYCQIALANDTELKEGEESTGIATASSYGFDIRKALKMTVTATDMSNNLEINTATSATKTFVYDFESLNHPSYTYFTDVNAATSVNAVGYVNNVLGYKLSTPSGYLATTGDTAYTKKLQYATGLTTDTAYSPFTIPTTGYLQVKFTIWLDGWDEYCYDTCRRQGFTLDMGFTTTATEAIIKTL